MLKNEGMLEHRKRWLQELRLDRLELNSFEADLRGIWATNFGLAEAETEDCAVSANPALSMQQLGRRVLQQTLGVKSPNLKGFDADYLARGSFHIMANGPAPTIGWHPHWQKRFGNGDGA